MKNIKERKNYKAFIDIYRQNQKKIHLLESITIPQDIAVADMTYSLEAKEIKTNIFLILALASLLGLMMGLVLVFLKTLLREEESKNRAISTQNTAMGNA